MAAVGGERVWARIGGWGAVGGEGVGHALEACKNFLSTAVSGGSTGACGVGV